MNDAPLEHSLAVSGRLVALGLIVQLVSFFWNHPLAFIAFAVAGGGLVGVGVALFSWTLFRQRAWRTQIPSPSPSRKVP